MFPIQTKIRIVILAGYLFPLVANSTLNTNSLYQQNPYQNRQNQYQPYSQVHYLHQQHQQQQQQQQHQQHHLHLDLHQQYPLGENLYDKYPHTVMYYYGVTVSDPLARMFFEMHRFPEHIQSLEYSYTLHKDNVVRRFFHPLVGVVQLAANLTFRQGSKQNDIYEFDPYICFRWSNFPWNHYVVTSLAIGEGISYASSYPALEKKSNENTKRLLNYLMLEASFASPYNPRVQVVARIHHRSGAYGLYHAGNTGSNVIGLGIRYLFG